MAENRGKKFEGIIKKAFERVSDTSVIRLPDPTSGYLGVRNICDFLVYHYPYQYFIECKTVHGNTLSIYSKPKADKNGVLHGFYGNITDNQWEGMLEESKKAGVIAGVICWWVEKDTTKFLPIQELKRWRDEGNKSVRYDCEDIRYGRIIGIKKRVFFDYDMYYFFQDAEVLRYG